MNSSVHIDNKGKDILIPMNEPTQGLGDTTLTAEAIYSINFTQSNIMKSNIIYNNIISLVFRKCFRRFFS